MIFFSPSRVKMWGGKSWRTSDHLHQRKMHHVIRKEGTTYTLKVPQRFFPVPNSSAKFALAKGKQNIHCFYVLSSFPAFLMGREKGSDCFLCVLSLHDLNSCYEARGLVRKILFWLALIKMVFSSSDLFFSNESLHVSLDGGLSLSQTRFIVTLGQQFMACFVEVIFNLALFFRSVV